MIFADGVHDGRCNDDDGLFALATIDGFEGGLRTGADADADRGA